MRQFAKAPSLTETRWGTSGRINAAFPRAESALRVKSSGPQTSGTAKAFSPLRQDGFGSLPAPLNSSGLAHKAAVQSKLLHKGSRTSLTKAAVASAASLAAPQEQEQEASAEGEQFQWSKQWYPMACPEFLDPGRPHPITLLGKDLVLWRDGSGTWRCFEDACPHRLAPLSEGRVESDGTLLCAYHAWRFDGSGNCVAIPSARDKEAEQRACSSPRACAVSHPTMVAHRLLWVWGEGGPASFIESAAKPPNTIEELTQNNSDGRAMQLTPLTRDLPYGADYFFENVLCPAHVPVSHHNLVGNRYTDAAFIDCELQRPLDTNKGFAYSVINTAPFGATIDSSIVEFRPPGLAKSTTTLKDGSKLLLCLYASPTTPGYCRHIGFQTLIKNDEGKVPRGLAFFALPLPVWFLHITASFFLHQDMAFLHTQEKLVARRGPGSAADKYYVPTPADKIVLAFRKWLETRAGGGIPFHGIHAMPPIDRDKKLVFDVYHSHTKHCKVCMDALANWERVRLLALAMAGVATVRGCILTSAATAAAAALAAVQPAASAAAATAAPLSLAGLLGGLQAALPPPGALAMFVLALAACGVALLSDKLIALFYKFEFNHQDNV